MSSAKTSVGLLRDPGASVIQEPHHMGSQSLTLSEVGPRADEALPPEGGGLGQETAPVGTRGSLKHKP